MSTSTHPFVVFGANGVQGQWVATELLRRNLPVRIATQSGTTNLPLTDQDEVVKASFEDPASLKAALSGAAGAYFNLPVVAGPRTGEWLGAFLAAAAEAQLPRLVFEPRGSYPDFATNVAMIEGNRAVTEAVLNSGIPAAVLKSTIYLDNLLGPWVKQELLESQVLRYPLLPDQRAGWATAEDSGKLAAALLAQDEFRTEAIDLTAFDDPSSAEIAAAIGAALGQPLPYETVSPEDFGRKLSQVFGSEEVGREIANLYSFAQSHPRVEAAPVSARVSELGVTPLTTAEWAAKQNWA